MTAFVRPSTERLALALDGLVEFVMVNNGREGLRCGQWNLHKPVEGEWFHIAPLVHTADCRVLHPGGRLRWSLRAFNGEAVGVGSRCDGDGLTAGHLGGGEYAVVAGYGATEGGNPRRLQFRGQAYEIRRQNGNDGD